VPPSTPAFPPPQTSTRTGWGNQELQCFVDTPDAARVEATGGGDGKLVITASYEPKAEPCYSGGASPSSYTQARALAAASAVHATHSAPLPAPLSRCCLKRLSAPPWAPRRRRRRDRRRRARRPAPLG